MKTFETTKEKAGEFICEGYKEVAYDLSTPKANNKFRYGKEDADFDFDFSVTKNGNEKQVSDVLFGIVQMLNNIEGNFEMAISLRANNG